VPRGAFYGLKDRDFRTTNTNIGTIKLEHDFGAFTLADTLRYGHTYQAYIYTQPDDTQGNVFGMPNNVGQVPGGQVWRRANTRFGGESGLFEQVDLTGKFDTGRIKHSIALGGEASWEKANRGAYVLATGSTISPRCTAQNVARYNCTSVFDPHPNDPWINYTSDSPSATPTPITKQPRSLEILNKADSWGFYGFDSITLIPALILNLGARVDRYHSETLSAVVSGSRPKASRTDTIFTWQAGGVFKPSKDTSLYISYATAATPPNSLLGEGRDDNALGTQSLTDSLKVTKTKNLELGGKALLFHDRLSITADVFRTDTSNARVTDANGNPTFIGKTRNQGFELGFNGNITEKWNIFGGYTYLDAKITDGGMTVTTATISGTPVSVSAPSVNDGKRVPITARHNLAVTTLYQVTPKLSIGGGAYYTSSVNSGYGDDRHIVGTVANHQLVITRTITRYVPGYVRIDANAGYKINDHIELRLNVENLTNKRYFAQVFTNHYATEAPGRTILGTVGLHF
jgi:catecholate siderophore receptor